MITGKVNEVTRKRHLLHGMLQLKRQFFRMLSVDTDWKPCKDVFIEILTIGAQLGKSEDDRNIPVTLILYSSRTRGRFSFF